MSDRYGSSVHIRATMPWVHYCLKLAERLINLVLFFTVSNIFHNVQWRRGPRGDVQPRSSAEWPCEAAVNRLACNAFKSPRTFPLTLARMARCIYWMVTVPMGHRVGFPPVPSSVVSTNSLFLRWLWVIVVLMGLSGILKLTERTCK